MTIGVGTAAGADLDLDGFRVHTQLDEATLMQIAEMTGGSYHRADDQDGIDADLPGPAAAARRPQRAARGHGAVRGPRADVLVVGGILSLAWAGRLP